MFKITDGKGFHITFENGYTVSVQWGCSNYCDNRDAGEREDNPRLGNDGCANADVMAWQGESVWSGGRRVRLGENEPNIGWQSPAEVLAILNRIAALPPIQEEKVVFPVPQPSTAIIVTPKAAQYGNLF